MAEDCKFCRLIAGKEKAHIMYEDAKVFAMLSTEPSSLGHVLVMPKEHYPIIEQVPDYIVAQVFNAANKISTAVFDALGAQGTNLLVNNGIAAGQMSSHFMVNVLPRHHGDNLNFQWPPKQLSEEEISTVELRLKEQTGQIGGFEKEEKKEIKIEKKVEEIPESEEDIFSEQLMRMP